MTKSGKILGILSAAALFLSAAPAVRAAEASGGREAALPSVYAVLRGKIKPAAASLARSSAENPSALVPGLQTLKTEECETQAQANADMAEAVVLIEKAGYIVIDARASFYGNKCSTDPFYTYRIDFIAPLKSNCGS